MPDLTEKRRAESNQPDLSFKTFLQDCLDGNIGENITYEQWKRNETVIKPLHQEHLDWTIERLEKGEPLDGNFYDWLIEVKGIELIPKEEALRCHHS
jgi:hypothetical protein